MSKRHASVGEIGFRGVIQDTPACEHIAGNRKAVAFEMPAPVDAILSGIGGDLSFGIHDVELSAGVPGICSDERFDNILGAASLAKQLHAVDPVIGIDQCLRGDAAYCGGDVRNARADREEFRGDRYCDLAGGIVFGNDRPGHRRN